MSDVNPDAFDLTFLNGAKTQREEFCVQIGALLTAYLALECKTEEEMRTYLRNAYEKANIRSCEIMHASKCVRRN